MGGARPRLTNSCDKYFDKHHVFYIIGHNPAAVPSMGTGATAEEGSLHIEKHCGWFAKTPKPKRKKSN